MIAISIFLQFFLLFFSFFARHSKRKSKYEINCPKREKKEITLNMNQIKKEYTFCINCTLWIKTIFQTVPLEDNLSRPAGSKNGNVKKKGDWGSRDGEGTGTTLGI